MVIGYDAKRAFQNNTGLGNYSRMVVCGVASHYRDFQAFLYAPKLAGYYQNYFSSYANISTHQPHGWDRFVPNLWRGFGIAMHLKNDGVQIFHGLSHELPHRIPASIKTVVTMHDLIAWRYPEYFSHVDAKIHQRKQLHSCRIADVVVAVSEQTKRDLIDIMHVPEEKIRVIYQSCDAQFWQPIQQDDLEYVRETYCLPQRYIIAVGTIEERKNQIALVEALKKLPSDVQLVLVGHPHGNYIEKLRSVLRDEEMVHRVMILDHADFEDFPALYANAVCSAYVSHFEGFGIPILESMCCDTPVLTSNTSSMPEVGGDAVLYADPNNVDQIAQQLLRLLDDEELRKELVEKGRAQRQKFSQKKSSADFYNLYSEMLSDDNGSANL